MMISLDEYNKLISMIVLGGKKKPLKAPKKDARELDDVSN